MTLRPRVIALVALTGLFGGACRATAAGGPALPAPPPVLDLTMTEYRFVHSPEVSSGRVVFRVRNTGRLPHDLHVLALGEDIPPIDEQLKSATRRFVSPLVSVRREPGRSGSFAFELVKGQRYTLVCFVRDPATGQVHALKGMSTEFRAGGGRPGPLRPAPPTAPTTTDTGPA